MPYQTNGVNYPSPGFSPYQAPFISPYNPQISIPYSAYGQVQPPSVQPTNYQTQVSNASSPVRGRFIKSETEITPSDVPMDGYASYFPSEDGSCIYVKFWDKDGKIQTRTFVPNVTDNPDTPNAPSFEDEMRQGMADIKKLLSQRPASGYSKYRKSSDNTQERTDNDA